MREQHKKVEDLTFLSFNQLFIILYLPELLIFTELRKQHQKKVKTLDKI